MLHLRLINDYIVFGNTSRLIFLQSSQATIIQLIPRSSGNYKTIRQDKSLLQDYSLVHSAKQMLKIKSSFIPHWNPCILYFLSVLRLIICNIIIMLSRVVTAIRFPFSIRMKGPISQRSLDPNEPKVKQKLDQNFFADYSPETKEFYKYGFTPSQLSKSNEMVKRAFSLQNATPKQILDYRIEQAIKKYQKNLLDHGSAAIQCAIMSERVILMMSHVSKYPRDKRSARYLTKLVQQRRTMLNYCMRTDYHRYKWVCIDYGIPDQHPKNSHHQTSWGGHYNSYLWY